MSEHIYPPTTIELESFLMEHFGLCGCSEMDTVVDTLIPLLEWLDKPVDTTRPRYQTLWSDKDQPGLFYILCGLLNDMEFAEHGVSIRFSWLTNKGRFFLEALRDWRKNNPGIISNSPLPGHHERPIG